MSGIQQNRSMVHSTDSTNLGDLLERILDKGVVIAGDVRIKIVDIELLTIEIRLLICSVDRAQEIGMDWWRTDQRFAAIGKDNALEQLDSRMERLEALLLRQSQQQVKEPSDE